MGKRRATSALAVVLGFTVLTVCLSHASASPSPATSDTGAVNALAKLRGWLEKPGPANINIYSFETSRSVNPVSTALQLSGATDVGTGTVQLIGQQRVFGGGSTTPAEALAVDGMLYSTVEPKGDSDGSTDNDVTKWTSTPLRSVRPTASRHSIWWLALQALSTVHLDGGSVVSTKGATEFTGTVNLAKVPGIPASFLKAPLFQKAGTTLVAFDLYTDASTGALVRLTYRFGLGASVDSTAVGQSTAGYQVDLYIWSLGSPVLATAPTPIKIPEAKYLVPGGNGDLCRLLLF